MVLAKELVDKLKKIEDFDITYESSDKVYAFKYRIMLSPSTYVALETGYSIKINDYNEREEV